MTLSSKNTRTFTRRQSIRTWLILVLLLLVAAPAWVGLIRQTASIWLLDDQHDTIIKSNTGNSIHRINNETAATTKAPLYIVAQTDRSGSVIASMLTAHAIAYANGVPFGGACDVSDSYTSNRTAATSIQSKRTTETVLLRDGLGLADDVLPFACPRTILRSTTKDEQKKALRDMQHYYKSLQEGIAPSNNYRTARSPEWLGYIRSYVNYPAVTQDDDENSMKKKRTVAIHLRRGDVTPCNHPERYTPNLYYLAVLDRYLSKNEHDFEVSVYSERNSFESFDVFQHRNYTLHLDTDLASVWKAFVSADVFVMARSDFSWVPALLNRNGRGGVLYTPFIDAEPLPEWTVVDMDLQALHDDEMKELVTARCSEHDLGRKFHTISFWSTGTGTGTVLGRPT